MTTGLLRTGGRIYGILFCIFMLAPMIVVLGASFTGEGYISFPPPSLSLRWYQEVYHNDTFMRALRYSLEIAAITAAASGALGVAAAVVLVNRGIPGRGLLVTLATMPLTLPHIVLSIALLQLFGQFAVPTAPYALLAGHILITAPYVLRLTMSSLGGLDPRLELASYTLGASYAQTLVRVVLPLGMRGITAGLLFAFLLSFDEVTISLFTALPGAQTLPAEIFNYASQGADPIIASASGIMIIISALGVVAIELSFGLLRMIAGEERPRRS
ncbi:MAG: ABC transporter permease [Chelatococcus sp.]|uniref:ABC transporter permease n=1 Tax=unclassified Chelatococcus TaxID=2638111 RepID=UPI001BCFF9D6|nr:MULTISPECIES: ABC transporter permease [unclassified Chelatococcus]CAH1658454.1 putative spermidine/putrescine transport system permease protein [Hyphomicrobiales bacterium]MBS7740804.1 ABC transporter permease [Chelatococcus sp. HY11]MBX3538509.1 ABC transporter permease [Chelatococcus sp.]MBX3545962.1 ABC transporter permease [Chelatococcus sp.]MCO5079588.1 ABC transporter permease [Chelatococcus sp.]